MKKQLVFSVLVLAGLGVGCSTVHVTRVQPGRGGELAVQEGIFGEPAHVKAERVMQGHCPDGYVIEEAADVKVGSTTVTQSETAGRASGKNVAASSTSVSETRDKTERRITWKCQPVAAEVAPVSAATPVPAEAPSREAPADPQPTSETPTFSGLQPTGWNADFSVGRRWYKPEDRSVANFHSTNFEARILSVLHPALEVGGIMHVDGYDNDTNADDEDFTSSLFELGVSAKVGPRFGVWRPYLVGNYYVFGGGNREYERSVGFVSEKYVGKNYSKGLDGALGLAWQLGEGSVYFEWYRSAQRVMTVKGRLEKQIVYPNGAVHSSSEGEKRSFKTRYDGFALGVSFPIRN
ncbi:hypothetical protein [Oligoflexus tunisiensis]|uniref:hypothetical protein n=1 Tax=Oligoflexus tunisiensis TaxID=708132 RepID=UPI00114C9052|nr:hypothetical protein [Oligoflexus tunisiensis]